MTMTEMEKNRAVGIAAERAAGRLRAMEWTEWQRMLLGLAHAAMQMNSVAGNAVEQVGGLEGLAIAEAAQEDVQALFQAMEILGWENGRAGAPVS